MLALIQRVNSAKVIINGKEHSSIDTGMLILLGIHKDDETEDVNRLIAKILKFKLFPSSERYFAKDIKEINGEILAVPQFTLYGEMNKGTKPSFTNAMDPASAESLYDNFCDKLKESRIRIKKGVFKAHMNVILDNDGPATFILKSNRT